jgi:hypothetical protein
MTVEPAGAAVIADTIAVHGATGQQLLVAADLDGFTLGSPMQQVVERLAMASTDE